MKIIEEKHKYDLSSKVWRSDHEQQISHRHKNVEIIQVLENGCHVLVNGNVYEAHTGDIVVIKEQAIHRCSLYEEYLGFRVVHFKNSVIMNTNNPHGDIKVHIKIEEIRSVPNLEQTLNSLFEIADREGTAVDANDNPFFQSIIASIYFLLLRYFRATEKEPVRKAEQDEFYKIVEYINSNYKENISIQAIAAALYLSRSRITRLFSKYSGMSISEYVVDLRIKEANHLLATGHTVIEAAMDSGFQSVRTFNNVYKANMGITPTEYKKTKK